MIAQRLRSLGFSGGLSILKECLHGVCAQDNDSRQWSRPLIEEAERYLAEALGHGRAGRTEWSAIVLCYEELICFPDAQHADRTRSGGWRS